MKLHVWITVVAACFSQTIRCTSDSEYESDSSVSLEEGPQPPDRVVRQSDVDSMERQQISVQLNAIDYAIQIEELFLITSVAVAGLGAAFLAAAFISAPLYRKLGRVPLAVIAGIAATACVVGIAEYFIMKDTVEDREAARHRQAILNPVPTGKLKSEACKRMEELSYVAEQGAVEAYGKASWLTMWKSFEAVFTKAQNDSNQKVLNHIMTLHIAQWPPIPPPPTLDPDSNSNYALNVYDSALKQWAEVNLFTIPGLKHDIEEGYSEMHFEETLAKVYENNDHPQYANTTVAFQYLSRSFLYFISLPESCDGEVHQDEDVKQQAKEIKRTHAIHKARVKVAINAHYELRNAMTKAKLEL